MSPCPGWGRSTQRSHDDFEPDDLRPLLDTCGVGATILVQASCTDTDTDAMFAQAAAHPWIGAVTAWVDLLSARAHPDRLDALESEPKLRGIRHLIHEEADPHWILRGRRAREPRGGGGAAGSCSSFRVSSPTTSVTYPSSHGGFPELTIVIDHLGKPPLAHRADGRMGGTDPPCSRLRERGRQGLGSEHDAADVGVERIGHAMRRSRSRSTASDPTGSCAAATGRIPC